MKIKIKLFIIIAIFSSLAGNSEGLLDSVKSTWAQATYAGVGLMLQDDPGTGAITVFSVTYRSPADRAQIRRGDQLVAIDGKKLKGKTATQAASLIRGPVGTSVSLILISRGAPKEVSLIRRELASGTEINLLNLREVGQGVFLTKKEKALVKQKILGLKTDAGRQRMMQLLQQLKSKQLSKPKVLRAIRNEFP